MNSHLDPEIEAAALCAFIKERVTEYESLQTQLEECVGA
jgi:plasmid rolling circle replication initiator protein Rep